MTRETYMGSVFFLGGERKFAKKKHKFLFIGKTSPFSHKIFTKWRHNLFKDAHHWWLQYKIHRLLLLLLLLLLVGWLVAIAGLSGKYESLKWVMLLNSEELNHFCKSCLDLKVKCNTILGVNNTYCILESICVDLLLFLWVQTTRLYPEVYLCWSSIFLWVPYSRFRLWVLVLWLLKLTNFLALWLLELTIVVVPLPFWQQTAEYLIKFEILILALDFLILSYYLYHFGNKLRNILLNLKSSFWHLIF